MLLDPGFGALLAELNTRKLDYVVVGGVAVNLLGAERVTGDVDVLVPDSAKQGAAIREALDSMGATRPDGTPLPDWAFDGKHHIRALTPHGLIDFIPEGAPPLDFTAVREAAQTSELYGVLVPRASLIHLAALKRLADRPIDREDMRRLEQAYGPIPELGDTDVSA